MAGLRQPVAPAELAQECLGFRFQAVLDKRRERLRFAPRSPCRARKGWQALAVPQAGRMQPEFPAPPRV